METDMLEGTVLNNVGTTERWVSGVFGALMTGIGLFRRSFGGILATLAGVYLLYRAVRGHCFVYDLLGINTRATVALRSANEPPPPSVVGGDEVTESSWESFPTSDAPSWTMGKREEDEV